MIDLKMKCLFCALLFLFSFHTNAQPATGRLPPFRMVLSNGSFFSREQIKKNKPVILIYFSPDCDHCKRLMKDFLARAHDFNGAEVVLITYQPLQAVQQFVRAYQLGRYANITVGTEVPMYYIRYYYNLSNTPFTVLFNRRGEQVFSYRKETDVTDLASRLQHLK